MRDWNEKQPGGQGLTADFNLYFKHLTDAQKEVRFHSKYITHLTCCPVALPKGNVRCKGGERKGDRESLHTR